MGVRHSDVLNACQFRSGDDCARGGQRTDGIRTILVVETEAFYPKAGYRPELAWTCRSGDGDRTKAYALLHEALAISSELGMRPSMERVLSRREILKA